jgi:uncharacterized protein YbjT (DUF2867 family)
LHSIQFFEFAAGIVQAGTVGDTIRLSSALFQPIASNDVVNALVDLTSKDPVNGIVEIGGPEKLGMDQFAKIYLDMKQDNREIIGDPNARYFGTVINDQSLSEKYCIEVGRCDVMLDIDCKYTLSYFCLFSPC